MRLIIDRFEGPYAVCEDENSNMLKIPKSELPKDINEGSVLIASEAGIKVDYEETAKRAERIKKKMDSLFK